jgi:hypothetical protein
MRRAWVLAWALLLCGLVCIGQSHAFWQSRDSNYNKTIAASTYQGPGDVFSGAIGWWSAARAYNAAYAAAQSPLFDIVDIATGLAACTVNVGTNGFANQTAAVCPTGAPVVNIVTFCTITHSGGCKFTQLYDQTGNGNPLNTVGGNVGLVVSGAQYLNNLPTINCLISGTTFIETTTTPTTNQPFTISAVFNRASGTNAAGVIGGTAGVYYLGTTATANQATVNNNSTNLTATAADATWHGVQGLFNGAGTSSAINVDGSDTTGATGTSSNATQIRICRGAANQLNGFMAEAGVWTSSSTSTQRNSLFANQNGANGYNGAL